MHSIMLDGPGWVMQVAMLLSQGSSGAKSTPSTPLIQHPTAVLCVVINEQSM